jgi:uncharacterized RmlC-like cupin family protein
MSKPTIKTVTPDQRVLIEQPPVPGLRREAAFAEEPYWAGIVTAEPGHGTGWHHHGDYDTIAYVVSGHVRVEWGPGGKESAEGGPGTLVYVPKGLVHQEITGDEEAAVVVVRVGEGPPVFPVDGPDPA